MDKSPHGTKTGLGVFHEEGSRSIARMSIQRPAKQKTPRDGFESEELSKSFQGSGACKGSSLTAAVPTPVNRGFVDTVAC